MNIVVLMKQVPDTALAVKVNAAGTGIESEGLEFVINPYDEYAIEESLKLKEAKGGKVTLLCAGPERAQKSIRQALAMGVDEAVQIDDPAVEAADTTGIAKALVAALKTMAPDLVFCGREAVDLGRASVGAAVAELMGLPQATDVVKVTVKDEKLLEVNCEREGGHAVLEVKLPAVLTAQKGLNEPRYASLKGIMAAKKKPIVVKKLADLGLAAGDVAAKTVVKSLKAPPVKDKSLKLFDGESAAAKAQACVKALVQDLKIV